MVDDVEVAASLALALEEDDFGRWQIELCGGEGAWEGLAPRVGDLYDEVDVQLKAELEK